MMSRLMTGVIAMGLCLGAVAKGQEWTALGGAWEQKETHWTLRGENGPKAVWSEKVSTDFQLDVSLRCEEDGGQAGVLFRAGDFAEGLDAFRGYYVGIVAGTNTLVWGAVDPVWRAIATRPLPVRVGHWYHLRIRAAGEQFQIYLEPDAVDETSWPRFDGVDAALAQGSVALRALDGPASFRDFQVGPWEAPSMHASYTNPVQGGAADPVVLFHEGTYYAYTTYTIDYPRMVRGIRLYTSTDLVHWKDEGFALKNEDSWGHSRFWAPDIVEKDGLFYLYYAADERMCVATAETPRGPFRQEKQEPMEPASIRIDGHIFEDEDGQRYFYYVTFDEGNQIWGGKLNDDLRTVDAESLRLMVKPDQAWERHQWPVTEGAEVLKHKGTYYLTYSGSHFENPEYAVGYATSDSPLGPWKKYEFNPVMKSTAYAHGTAHHCFTRSPDGEGLFIIYHRHHSSQATEPRQLSVDRVRFVPHPEGGPDILQIHGPTSSPQPMPLENDRKIR
ncbi:family 43 glycosylhydrolase [Roseibacillus ishigakijimensis]|uniref:Family 43 glycosylhydrolase n=1 Tax=Roseibacillus ishigakijimensis TaxID=454146 RepID=A0A934RRJ7_9BACT|nr:family 43 glycosylhydrolase [Roseibacillus ishigakijimensis]MBK1833226.1 family 43 glycosylhydrolase [Roseibacillus ishigakijimensis]